jgi:hypothetical protein
MTYLNSKKAIALWTILFAFAAAPQSASARGSIHLDLPHISLPHISFSHHGNHRSKHYRKQHERQYYRDSRRHGKRYNKQHRYSRDYYRSNNYYQPRSSPYNRGYSAPRNYDDGFEYCPSPAYSLRNDPNRNCQVHGEHFHCEG